MKTKETQEEIIKPNYFAIIPAEVRYDKRLNAEAKLLYAEISSLTNAEGFCFATNSYFAKLFEKDERTIRRHISQLAELGYVTLVIDKNTRRKIYIKGCFIPRTKMSGGEDKNVLGTPDKNVLHNNINNNNKIIIYSGSKKKKIKIEEHEYTKEEYESFYDNDNL